MSFGDFLSENKVAVGITVVLICGGVYGYKTAPQNLNGIDKSYFINNAIGIPLTANVSEDAIKVAVSSSFNDEQKQHIKNAIEELDIDVKGVEYEIILDETVESPISDLNCIHIKKTGEISHQIQDQYDKNYNGKTTILHNPFTGKIMYPLTINLHVESINNTAELRADTTEYYDKDGRVNIDNGKSHQEYYNEALQQVFKRVVKHEMLHTLGLADQYADDMETKTIMYYSDTYDAPIDLTEHDKHIVNTVYTTKIADTEVNINSKIQLPNNVKVPESAIKKFKEKHEFEPEF